MNQTLEYQRQEILSASPVQLIVKLYEVALTACFRGDRHRLRRALAELMSALKIGEGGELADRLYSLYEYCMELSVSGDLDEVRDLLTELRDAWRIASKANAA